MRSFKLFAALSICLFCLSGHVYAHPEDEFCNDGGLDPLLCAELAALDSDKLANTSEAIHYSSTSLWRTQLETFMLYIKLGVEHILPAGFDHLIFVLALLLSCLYVRQLIIYISFFTLAHTVSLGVMTVFPSWTFLSGVWVEVCIALSIVWVGFENIGLAKKLENTRIKTVNKPRVALIFGFGLLHGLGFAGALKEIGMPGEHLLSALLGFNVGVEIAQVGFALVIFSGALLLIKRPWYRKLLVLPTSTVISLIGSWWVLERLGVF